MDTNKKAPGGKSFFVVLALCAAVVGASAWVLLSDAGTPAETTEEPGVDVSAAVVTMLPRSEAQDLPVLAPERTPAPTATPRPTPAPEPEPTAKPVFNETVTTYVWPVRGELESPYAVDTLRYDPTMADWRAHDGIDIACALGDEVIAAAGGTVVRVEKDDLYGTVVELDHANGIHTVYANLADDPPVGEGDVVTMGQILGSVGKTALAETNMPPHLHFAMTLDGRSADPLDYLDGEWGEE